MIVAAAVLGMCCPAHAGEYAGEFMAIGVGARALAMGGAFCAVADDASSVYWNPAGMATMKGVEVSSIKLIDQSGIDSNYTYLSMAYNIGGKEGAFGLSFLNQSFDNIILTDSGGAQTGAPSALNDNAACLSYARKITGWLSAGVTVKLLFGSYPTGTDSIGYSGAGGDIAVIIDAGEIMDALKGFRAAVNVQDFYTGMNWGTDGNAEKVRLNIKSGIAYAPFADFMKGLNSKATIAADYDTAYGGSYHAGGEYSWNDTIWLRAGLQGFISTAAQPAQEASWSAGGGIKWYFIGVDYAFVKSEFLSRQYISISGRF